MGPFALPPQTKLTDALLLETCVVEGPVACIYHATQNGQRVAAKVLHPSFAAVPELATFFLEGARAAARAPLPQAPRILGSGSSLDGVPYIVTEPLDAVLLQSRMRASGGRLDARVAADLVLRLLEALEACHARGVFLGDLRPESVAIGGTGLQLWDAEYQRLHVAILGKVWTSPKAVPPLFSLDPRFAAPELCARRQAYPNAGSDVFAAGALLLHLLSGHHIFEELAPEKRLERASLRHPSEPWPLGGIATPLRDIVAQALAFDPTNRYPSAHAFRSALVSAAAHLPSRPQPTKTAQVMTMKSEFAPKELLPTAGDADEDATIAADSVGRLSPLGMRPSAPNSAGRPLVSRSDVPPASLRAPFGSIADVSIDEDDDEKTIAQIAPSSHSDVNAQASKFSSPRPAAGAPMRPAAGAPARPAAGTRPFAATEAMPGSRPAPWAARPEEPRPPSRPAPPPSRPAPIGSSPSSIRRPFAQTAAMGGRMTPGTPLPGAFGDLELPQDLGAGAFPPRRDPASAPMQAAPPVPPEPPQPAQPWAPAQQAPAFGNMPRAQAPAAAEYGGSQRPSGFLDSSQLFQGLPVTAPPPVDLMATMPAATSADLGLRPAAPVSLRQIPSIAPPNMVGTGTAPTPKNRLLVIAVIALVFLALVVAVAAVIIVVRG